MWYWDEMLPTYAEALPCRAILRWLRERGRCVASWDVDSNNGCYHRSGGITSRDRQAAGSTPIGNELEPGMESGPLRECHRGVAGKAVLNDRQVSFTRHPLVVRRAIGLRIPTVTVSTVSGRLIVVSQGVIDR